MHRHPWQTNMLYWMGAIFFLLTTPVPAFADEALFEQKRCGTCHRLSADEPAETHPAPDLFYAGDKYQHAWLIEYLQNPGIVRKMGHPRDPGFLKGEPEFKGPHMSVSKQEAESLASLLMAQKLEGLEPLSLDFQPLARGERVRAKMLFERDHSCIACHESYNLARQPRGGVSGPSLINAGNRLQPGWVYRWLKNPRQFTEKSRMPVYDFDEIQLKLMTRYVLSHKKGE
ncbi:MULTISPECIES: c-type cytochrome [unclassified Nitrospina]|uniref:c-type cytochrome n=1 Tax=unclassified Nitrospina TaxID=2638683 RepID=UPI003F954469